MKKSAVLACLSLSLLIPQIALAKTTLKSSVSYKAMGISKSEVQGLTCSKLKRYKGKSYYIKMKDNKPTGSFSGSKPPAFLAKQIIYMGKALANKYPYQGGKSKVKVKISSMTCSAPQVSVNPFQPIADFIMPPAYATDGSIDKSVNIGGWKVRVMYTEWGNQHKDGYKSVSFSVRNNKGKGVAAFVDNDGGIHVE